MIQTIITYECPRCGSLDRPDFSFENYTYDARGNMLTSAHSDGMGGYNQISYAYDARNQLVGVDNVTDITATDSSYAYDHDGRRVQTTLMPYGSAAITTDYLWDEFSTYSDVVLETGTNPTRSYTLAAGMLISQTDSAGTLYFLPDAQGSTRALTDEGGLLGQTFDYDAFGNLQGDYQNGLDTNYLYTDQQFDPFSELYSLRARYYDPSLGRFLTRDTWPYDYQNPVELNRYVYTANNPATMVDPSGYFGLVGYAQNLWKDVTLYASVGRARGAAIGGALSAVAGDIAGPFLVAVGETIGYALRQDGQKTFSDILGFFVASLGNKFKSVGNLMITLAIDAAVGAVVGLVNESVAYGRAERFYQQKRLLRKMIEKLNRIGARTTKILITDYTKFTTLTTMAGNWISTSGLFGMLQLYLSEPSKSTDIMAWLTNIVDDGLRRAAIGAGGALFGTAVGMVLDEISGEFTIPGTNIKIYGDIFANMAVNSALVAAGTIANDFTSDDRLCDAIDCT